MSARRRYSGSLLTGKKQGDFSQNPKVSNVSEALMVSPATKQRGTAHKRGNSVKKAVNITGNERPVKSKDSNVSSTRSKRKPHEQTNKPAWLMKQTSDITPRTDGTLKDSHGLHFQPSVLDFLEVEPNEEPNDSSETQIMRRGNNSTKQPKTRKNLLEFLSSDTPRSDDKESKVQNQKHPVEHTRASGNEEFYFKHFSEDDQDESIYKIESDLMKTQNIHSNKGNNSEELEKACKVIQLWWRRVRRTAGKIAMQRLMESKRNEMQNKLTSSRQYEYEKQVQDFEQLREREEKARNIRRQIIEDLHNKKTSQKYSQSNDSLSGKKKSNKLRIRSKTDQVQDMSESILKRPDTSSSIGRKVDEIFESSCYDSNASVMTISKSKAVTNCEEMKDNCEVDASIKSKATFDNLMNTLKELEDDSESVLAESKYFTCRDDNKISSANDMLRGSSLLSADKLQSIMSFLDEIEKVEDDRSVLIKESVSSSQLPATPEDSADIINTERFSTLESASQVASDITNAIQQQQNEIDEKQKTVDMMKKAIDQQKEFTKIQMRAMDKEHKQQLSIQREDYESTIKRHLSFIDQLIDDKKVLTQRCEELVSRLKDIDQKYSAKIKQMSDSHDVEFKKQKEIMEAAEKLRREKWIKEKTQEIKEITVKGLEPDIQKLIAKHKAEIKKIKAMKQGEVLEADQRIGRKYIQQLEDLRAQLENEKEIALKKERDSARQRCENQIREEEESFQQQRRRLYKEMEEEKQRLSEQTQNLKKEFDERKSAYEISFKQSYSVMEAEYQKQLKEAQKNQQEEVKKLKEQLDIEKQQWIENYMKKQETHLLSKERELKEGVREARDREIEMVIARLEKESSVSREESERAAENRIKRIRDKYENEIKELEYSERTTQEKCSALKAKVDEIENECIRLKSDCKAKDQQLSDINKLTERLQEERGKVSDIIRQEFADRLVALEEESKRLRTELSEEKSRHKFEIDRLMKNKEDEMEEVHKRVKMAITKKEETTQMLRQQMMTAEKRAEHLEQLLADQRKKILGK